MSKIQEIIEMEWDEVAELQGSEENKKAFDIMRKSQFELWSNELVNSYYLDYINAKQNGWNLTYEKYARMLKYTDLKAYEDVKHLIPFVEEEVEEVVDLLASLLGGWMKQFAKRYPRLAALSRKIQAFENQKNEMTYEEMVKCELLTYSPNTLMLLMQMIIDYKKRNINYIQKMMEITVRYYNYTMIDEAERKL